MQNSAIQTPLLKKSFNFAWPFPERQTWLYRLQSNVVIFGVFCFAKFVLCGLNKIKISSEHKKIFLDLIEDKTRPLITMANHRSVVDDPLVWALFSFKEFCGNISRFRYILAANDICFTNILYNHFFALGRCVPCVRGDGVFQRGVNLCVDRLSNNGWVHIFPEAEVTTTPIRIKWGVARMIADSKLPPILLPMWTRGMADAWPNTRPYFPRIGKTVEIHIGTPIDTAIWISASPMEDETELQRRKRLADLVQEKLYALGEQVEKQKFVIGERKKNSGSLKRK
uniref:Tafazzin family protein n=2 Tax=Meloidogyne incognita group TaxID=654580 RepID=A0A914KPT6_MELIC